MAITITDRPSKTLSNGFLSKWSSSELPLQYDLESDLFPVNKVDTTYTITNLVYAPDKSGVVVTFSFAHSLTNLESISISNSGTDLDGGIFNIKNTTTTTVTLDFFTTQSSSTGSAIKYYPNYKGLIKVFSGAPDQHPYNLDSSKPLLEIGVLEVDFKEVVGDNVGVANVNGYVKARISAKFDNDFENTHFGWGSFSIQFAESYDVSNGVEISTFESTFEDDIQPGCDTFTDFTDPSFSNGLTDWTEQNISGTYDTAFVGGVGDVSVSITQGTSTRPVLSRILYQTKQLYAGIEYKYSFNVVHTGDSPSCGVSVINSNADVFGQTSITVSGFYELSFTPNADTTDIGIAFGTTAAFGQTSNITLSDLSISTAVAQPCLFTQWANFGAKQFQDSLGGNFGDYILNVVDSITPKMLTHFEEVTYFYGKPIYFNCILPQSTISLSEGGDNVFLQVQLFNPIGGSLLNYTHKLELNGEGVYKVDPKIKEELDKNNRSACSWVSGTVQFIIVPGNTFTDAINGTFEDANTANWSLTSLLYSPGTPNQIGNIFTSDNSPRTGSLNGIIDWTAPSMNETSKLYSIFENDNEINVTEGRTYEISSYLVIEEFQYEPSQKDNASFYWLPDGYTKEECTVSPWELIDSNIVAGIDPILPSDYKQTVTTFVAKATETIKLIFYNELTTDINISTGGNLLMDDITFKGPFEFISEEKTLKNSCECTNYGGTLRWLNDLNGWDVWYFNKKRIDKERVSNKIDIIRDYTTNWDETFVDGDTVRDTIKTSVNKSTVLRSQLLTINEKTVLEQIKRSARVQVLMDSGKWQTVTIKQSGYTILDQTEKVHEMEIEINLPDLIIQAQ